MSFPIGLSNGPPPGGNAPNGRNGLAEVAAAGVTVIRTGRADWSAQQIDMQLTAERALLDAAGAHGLHGWLWLGDLPNLPAGATSPEATLLSAVADGVQGHAALSATKGSTSRAIRSVARTGSGRPGSSARISCCFESTLRTRW